jgi:putative heme-binding domain-containing protein
MHRPTLFLVASLCLGASFVSGEPLPLFDGKTFAGWEGDTDSVWRIERGEIVAGKPDEKLPKNNFLCTTREFADFDLRLEYRRGDNNGGIQFRSQRVPNHHEVSGYQADFASGIDGCLYDESRRNRFLGVYGIGEVDLASEAGRPGALIKLAQAARAENEKKLGIGEWNRYRIRAEGPRIRLWINDVLTVDYTEKDAAIPLAGKIAIQIHGGATEIRYRNITIEEIKKPSASATPADLKLQPGDTVALTGGSNMERTRFNGFLQTHLITSQPEGKIRVRNFGWEGDTVFEQWRDGGNYENLDAKRREGEIRMREQSGSSSWRQQRDWREQLTDAGATVVIAQFGQMESLNGLKKLPAFLAAYEKLIAEFADGGRRVVLVAPIPFEKSQTLPLARDLSALNGDLSAYTSGIRDLAKELGLLFIEVTKPGENRGALTENGYQLTEDGHRFIARRIAEGLGIAPKPEKETKKVRQEILQAERLWFDYWRPMNWAFLNGDRTTQPYSKDWKDGSKRIFPEEMKDFEPLLKQADENVWNALADRPVTPIAARSSIPVEPPSAKPQSPEEELASFKILDGFQVNLFASEADGVVKPIQMRWDELGRLWVACAVSYPQIKPGEKPNDYVLVCEDTDGDGRADKFHKFVEGLFMPSGLELGDGGLYVAQGTELLHFRDTDGDGRADTSRIVMGGFGTADSHQMINCINWGFGGELWFTQGHHIYSRVETPHGVETLNRAGVWRLRPRTGHLDPFFQWSSAGANCWGVVTDDWGQPFHKSGANIGAYYCTPGLVRSDLAVNAQALNLCLAPIKQVGMEFLQSSHFPKEMQGRIVIGGYYANLLEWHELKLEDGIYRTELLPNIIETKNNVFRPVEVRMGPDGAIYVADWYNPIIGHYQASYRHPDRDKAHGRVWRVTMKDRQLVKPAKLADASVAELLEQLDSPERWAKYQAKRLLFEKDSREVVAGLDAWVAKDDYQRLQALSLYEAHETLRPDLLKALLRSTDPRIRAYSTRTLSTWARDGRLPDALALLETQIADDDPQVRLEAIVAASYVKNTRAALVAARALDKPFNAYHQHALTKTLHATNALWAPGVTAGTLDFDRDEHLVFALQNGWVENNPDDLKNLTGAPVAYKPTSASDAVGAIMRRQIERSEGQPERQSLWLKSLAAIAGSGDLAFLLERGGRDPNVLAALATSAPLRRERPDNTAALLEPLFSAADTAIRQQALRLAGVWKLAAFSDRIRSIAGDETAPLPLRQAAVSAIGDLGGSEAVRSLLAVLDNAKAVDLHAPALDALVGASADQAVKLVFSRLNGLKTVEEAAPLFRALTNRTEGVAALGRALAKPDPLPAPAAKLALQALNSIGRADAKLSPLLMKAAGINTALPAYTKEYVANAVKAAQSFGNAAEGKKIYEQVGCIACHIPGAAQSKIGPDLSAISRGLPIDMIVTELVWPALNVKEGYEAATVTMKDGRVIAGFKQTETADIIAIRDPATGQIRTLRRPETASIQTGGTVMPDGLTAGLDERQLAHLVRYLSELGK